MRSKKLLRQIKKTLNSEEFETELLGMVEKLKVGASIDDSSGWAERLSQFGAFLDSVDNSYSQNETMLELANRSLEVSTKELYEANERFRFINDAINSMVNSLDEGFLVIDRQGKCGEVVSLAAKNFLGREPVGEHLADILNIPDDEKESFNEWMNMVFEEVIPFEDLIDLAPKVLSSRDPNQPEARKIEIKYRPIRKPDVKNVQELVVILIDVSEKAEAERKLGEQKLFTDMVIKYLNNKTNFVRMVQMYRETTDSMKSWVFGSEGIHEQFNGLTRELHTLKGGLNTLSMYELGHKIHQTEDEILTFCKNNNNLVESENLIHFLGQEMQVSLDEFLQKHKRIFNFEGKAAVTKEVPTNNIYKFCGELLKMGFSDLLKYYVDEIVAVPFASLFAPVEASVYSQSLSQDKTVEFKVVDPEKIRVIPEFYSGLFEQMVHIFNNIMDHGIEPSEERMALEKETQGHITINLSLLENLRDKSQSIHISICDDGRGINPETVRNKLAGNGVDVSGETDESVINHIFDQGFSTRSSASMTSGRGVGMTAVLKHIESMGGSITVRSKVGQGTTFDIFVPYVKDLNPSVVNWFNRAGFALSNHQSNAS